MKNKKIRLSLEQLSHARTQTRQQRLAKRQQRARATHPSTERITREVTVQDAYDLIRSDEKIQATLSGYVKEGLQINYAQEKFLLRKKQAPALLIQTNQRILFIYDSYNELQKLALSPQEIYLQKDKNKLFFFAQLKQQLSPEQYAQLLDFIHSRKELDSSQNLSLKKNETLTDSTILIYKTFVWHFSPSNSVQQTTRFIQKIRQRETLA